MTHAELLQLHASHYIAWTMPAELRAMLLKEHRNQHGRLYVFEDGSRAFVPKGRAAVQVRER